MIRHDSCTQQDECFNKLSYNREQDLIHRSTKFKAVLTCSLYVSRDARTENDDNIETENEQLSLEMMHTKRINITQI